VGPVVETEPSRDGAHLVEVLAELEDRGLDAHANDVFHRRDSHIVAEDVGEVIHREARGGAQMLDP